MKKLQNLFVLLSLSLSVLMFGCSVGLGTAVDIESPTVSVTYPPDASAVRGTLLISGECNDDIGVAKVEAYLENSDTSAKTEKVSVKFADNKWSMSINTKELPDGKYTVNVSATDGAGRDSLTASRSFEIDNTPPVVILSKPLAVTGGTPSTFGRVFKIAGDVSDDHIKATNETDAVTLKFNFERTDASGNKVVDSILIDNVVSMTSEDPLVIAQYYDENDPDKDEKLFNNYKAIYGDLTKVGDKFQDREVKCTIEIEDLAREYNGENSASGGNRTTKYYINSTDFYDQLMSENAYNLTATKLSNIFKGTYTGTDKDEILAILNNEANKFFIESDAIGSEKNTSLFKLNPDNNPVFLAGGFQVSNTRGEDYTKFNIGNSLLVTVECGRDEVSIDETSIDVKFTRLIDKETITLTNDDLHWQDGSKLLAISNEITILGDEDPVNAPKDSAGKYFFQSGNCYLLEITGYDENHVEIKPKDSGLFGFELSSKSSAPKAEIEEDGEFYNLSVLKSGLDIEFTLKEDNCKMFTGTYAEGSTVQTLENDDYERITLPSVAVYKNGNAVDNITIEKKDVKLIEKTKQAGDKGYYNYKIKIKVGYQSGSAECTAGDGKYKFTADIRITDIQNNSALVNKQFYIDCNPPQIGGFEDVSGTVVNGTFTIKGTVIDNQELASVTYKIGNDAETPFADFANPSLVIDSTQYTDNTDLNVVITAKDGVGNTTTKELTYHIDQSTDKPVITGSNFDLTVTTPEAVKYENNKAKNIFNSNDKLTGYITDDDGDLAQATITFYKANGSGVYSDVVTITDQPSLPLGNGKTFSNIKVPAVAGIYKIKIYAKDSKQENTGYYDVTKEFYIAVDNNAPVINETGFTDAEFYTNGSVTFNVELSDDWDTSVLASSLSAKVYSVKESGDVLTSVTPTYSVNASTCKGTVTVDLSAASFVQGKYKTVFTITDRAGKTATKTRNFQKETEKPTIKEAGFKPAATTTNGYYGKSEINVEGSYNDNLSGIAKVEYQIGGTAADKWQNFSITPGTIDSKPGATFKGLVSGLKNNDKVYLRATDKAGNVSSETYYIEAKIDTTAPAVTDIKDGANAIGETYRFNAETTKTFTFKAADSESGVDSVTTTISENAITGPVSGVYTITIPAGKITQTGPLYVTAKDKVGNSKEYMLCNIIYDNFKPTVNLKSVKYYGTENTLKKTETYDYNDANGKIVISGTASDTELSKIWLEYSSNGTTYTKLGDDITDGPQSWSFTVDTSDTSKFTDKSKYYFKVFGLDLTGNKGDSGAKTVYINQDSDRPKINLTSTYYDTTNSKSWLKKTKELYFNVTDDDGEIDELSIKVYNSSNVELEKGDNKDYQFDGKSKITFTEDGTYTIKFTVKEIAIDGVKKEYSADGTLKPKLIGNDDNAYSAAVLNITVDTEPPEIGAVKFASKKTSTGSEPYKTAAESIFGGDYKYFDVQITASDQNDLSSIEIYKGTTKVGETTSAANGTNEVKAIDISSLDSGNHEFTIVVTDKAGMEANQKFNITVDNDAPVITTTSPDAEEQEGIAFTVKGEVTGSDQGSTIKYLIDATAGDYDVTSTKWNSAEGFTDGDTVTTWRLYVDGDVNNQGDLTPETHSKSHKQLFVENYSNIVKFDSSNVIILDKTTGELYETPQPLYFHFLVSDKAGNKGTCTLKLMIDPQGDIPTVNVDAPAISEYLWYTTDSVEEGERWVNDVQGNTLNQSKTINGHTYKYKGKGTTLSGSINVQGSADPKVGTIEAVYMQIDPTYDPSTGFDETPWKKSTAAAVRAAVLCPNGAESTATGTLPDSYVIEEIKSGMWGVNVGDSSSWSKIINQNNLFVYSTGSNKIALRFYAKNDAGKVTTLNALNDLILTIDSDAPVFAQYEPFYLYQFAWKANDGSVVYTNKATVTTSDKAYSDSGCTKNGASITATATNTITTGGKTYTKDFISKSYDEGTAWLTGVWWLRFSVHDEQDVSKITIDNETVVENNTTTWTANGSSSTVERNTSWDSGTQKGFIVNYRVGKDSEDSYGRETYTITATDYKEEEQDQKTSTRDIIINYDNKAPSVSQTDAYFNINKSVVNSHGEYAFSAAAMEDARESGYRTALYYFKQTNTSKIYKLSKNGTTKETYSYTGNKDLYTNPTGVQVTAVSGNTITVANASGFAANTMVLFGGSYYVVSEISGSKLTLDGKPSTGLVGQNVYAVYGNVVPAEKVTSSGSRYIWNAAVDSTTMNDGPVEIHYVVFDKAGNVKHDKVEAIVGNNAPRVASVKVWCDTNRNTTEDEGEYKEFFYNERTIGGVTKAGEAASNLLVVGDSIVNNKKVKRNFPTKSEDPDPTEYMTVKDVFTVMPEIVGGNGALYYSYAIADRADCIDKYNRTTNEYEWDSTSVTNVATTFGTSTVKGDDPSEYISGSQVTGYKPSSPLTIATSKIENISNDNTAGNKVTYFEFTIWDSTTYLTAFTDSLHAKIQMALKVQYKDTQAPAVHIGKFGYGADWDYTPDTDGKITTEKYNAGTAQAPVYYPYSHVYGMNLAKGHVELEDDWKLATGYVSSDITGEYDADPKASGWVTLRGVATDNVYINELDVTFPGIAASGVKVAEYNSTSHKFEVVNSYATDLASSTTGLKFAIIDEVYNDDGHYIEWQCDIDTEKVNANKAQLDTSFSVKAVAARGADAVKNGTGSYRMDIVPYITGVTTTLPSPYNRTALGHYPVSETPTIKCFNGTATFTVDGNATSGAFEAVNGTIKSLNNVNNPNAVYNQIASEVHNLLSDDVYFDIWDINSNAALPHDDRILDAQMKINPNNGMIGFAFCNGKSRWSMPNGTSNSYQAFSRSPDFFQCTGFAYNSSGISFGVALGGESNSGSNLTDDFNFFVSSKGCPGDESYNNSRTNTNAFHIASMYQHNTKNGGTEEYYVKNRFASPSIATNGINIYLAYYDRINKEIRFHGGTLNNDNSAFNNGNTFASNYNGSRSDDLTYTKSIGECQVVADDNTGPTKTGVYGGEYVSIAVTSGDAVIMVWYDENAKALMYSYLANGSSNIKTGVNRTGWTTPVNLTPDLNAGEFCEVAVDSDNGVHIACYDSTNTGLRYIYIPTYTTPATNISCLVDSYLDVGNYITIDVAKETVGGTAYQIPHIGYWANSPEKPVYAYIADPATFFDADSEEEEYSGVYNDKFTGTWEVSCVPTASAVFQTEDSPLHMNVGVWKTEAGVKQNSTTGTSTSSTENGTCYGNGTSNGVMGYIIENGTKTKIETAQKRN